MEDVYQILSKGDKPFQLKESRHNPNFEATDIWLNKATGRTFASHPQVSLPGIDEWLTTDKKGGSESLLVRLIWVDVDHRDNQIGLHTTARERITKHFGLELPFEYFQTFTIGVTPFPREKTANGDRRAFALNYAPKTAALWSHSRYMDGTTQRSLTQGFIFTADSNAKQKQVFQQMLRQAWDQNLCASPAFPAYLMSIILGKEIDETQKALTMTMREAESATGHHNFGTRGQKSEVGRSKGDGQPSLAQMAKKASGYVTKLASSKRKSTAIGKIHDFILEILQEESHALASQDSKDAERHAAARDLMQFNVNVLQRRREMQQVDGDYLSHRAEIQVQAVFHEIAAKDAKASQQLAEATYKDGMSMKTLAWVTMIFLPGSFVSSLFSTDLFDWDSRDLTKKDIRVGSTPQHTLYWVITIPLTTAIFAVYWLWSYYLKTVVAAKARQKQKMKEQESNAQVRAKLIDQGRTPTQRVQAMTAARLSRVSTYWMGRLKPGTQSAGQGHLTDIKEETTEV